MPSPTVTVLFDVDNTLLCRPSWMYPKLPLRLRPGCVEALTTAQTLFGKEHLHAFSASRDPEPPLKEFGIRDFFTRVFDGNAMKPVPIRPGIAVYSHRKSLPYIRTLLGLADTDLLFLIDDIHGTDNVFLGQDTPAQNALSKENRIARVERNGVVWIESYNGSDAPDGELAACVEAIRAEAQRGGHRRRRRRTTRRRVSKPSRKVRKS